MTDEQQSSQTEESANLHQDVPRCALMLRSLTIRRYEQFRDCPTLQLSSGDNLLLGLNGSGKTSLLRLIAAILRFNYDAILDQPFHIEFELAMVEHESAFLTVQGQVRNGLDEAARVATGRGRRQRSRYGGLEATFTFGYPDGNTHTVQVADSRLFSTDPGTSGEGRAVDSWLSDGLSDELGNVGSWRLSQFAKNTFVVRETERDFLLLTNELAFDYQLERDHDEKFPLFGEPAFSGSEPANRQWQEFLFELAYRAANGPGELAHPPAISFDKTAVAPGRPYDTSLLLEALGAESISARLQIEKSASREGRLPSLVGNGVEIRVCFESGTEIADARLTFGQKRLITIGIGALISQGSPILVDEIDNGLHPALLKAALDMIRDRQTFMASHNKLVVDMLDYHSADDIRTKILICRRSKDGIQTVSQLSEEEAQDVFEKVEIGLMSPSDVLRSEGLW